jgi:hypothetical protein
MPILQPFLRLTFKIIFVYGPGDHFRYIVALGVALGHPEFDIAGRLIRGN